MDCSQRSITRALATCFAAVSLLLVFSAPAGAFGFLNGINMNGEGASGTGVQTAFPSDAARDSQGNYWIADNNNNRILKLSPSGSLLLRFGTYGNGNGQFSQPYGIAIGPSDTIFVADVNNHRIQKFDSSGAFLAKWGSSGTGDGQFAYPTGLSFGPDGLLYVADCNNHRIQVFNTSGVFQFKFGSVGTGDGQMNFPGDVDLDSAGNIYVAEIQGKRVQKFSPGPSPAYITKWGAASPADPNYQFESPKGIAVDSSNKVYVTDGYYDRIKRFTSAGVWEATFGSYGTGNNQSSGTAGINVDDASGNLLVADAGNFRIKIMNTDGVFQSSLGTSPAAAGNLNEPSDVAPAPGGGVYVVDAGNSRVQQFDVHGAVVREWGTFGMGDGMFRAPTGIAVGAGGNVYVADNDNNRIEIFSSTGVYIGQWGSFGTATGQFNSPQALTTDAAGNVYVADGYNSRIEKFDSNGVFLASFGQFGSAPNTNDLDYPVDVAVNPAGTEIYVLDASASRVKKLDGTGAFVANSAGGATGASSLDGRFYFPYGLTYDNSDQSLLVADTNNNRVQRLTTALAFSSKWGTGGGVAPSEFQNPLGIAADEYGNVWVADTKNHRIQRFGNAPVVTITSPTNGTSTTSSTFEVQYSVSDAGAVCDVASGATVGPLPVGSNTITVTCTNALGAGAASTTVNVTAPQSPPPPSAFDFTLKKKIKLASKLKLPVSCSEACRVTSSITIGKRVRKMIPVTVPDITGAQKTVSLKVPKSLLKAAKTALSDHKKVTLTVTVAPVSKATQGKTGKARLIK